MTNAELLAALDENQKRNKIRNLLQAIANAGFIWNAGSRWYPQWALVVEKKDEN